LVTDSDSKLHPGYLLETALNGRAEVLVTLNIADFIPASHFRLPVSTPGAFLRQLQEEKN